MEHADIWIECARQVPALLVLVFLTIKFLNFLSSYQLAENARTERVAVALEKHNELAGRVVECLNSNSRALEQNTRMIDIQTRQQGVK